MSAPVCRTCGKPKWTVLDDGECVACYSSTLPVLTPMPKPVASAAVPGFCAECSRETVTRPYRGRHLCEGCIDDEREELHARVLEEA